MELLQHIEKCLGLDMLVKAVTKVNWYKENHHTGQVGMIGSIYDNLKDPIMLDVDHVGTN